MSISDGACSADDHLPQTIIINTHSKVSAALIPTDALRMKHKEKLVRHQQLLLPYIEQREPVPKYPLVLAWSPPQLHFDLFEETVDARLWVWNITPRPLYTQCCGLWNDTSRLGASWRSGPRTRFWLSPGLKAEFFVRATPLSEPPYLSTLQISAGHLRDQVTGYFMVPVNTCFLKYVKPALSLGE